ncbi:MAG: lasso peptide biosynthesis B2 protein [Pseudomarimonas sp.]
MSALAYRWLWLRCLLSVLVVRMCMFVDATGALRRSLRRSQHGRDPSSAQDWQMLMTVGHATVTAGSWVVNRQRPCLPIAMATQLRLAGMGYRAVLRLGVGRADTQFEAHAWVECGGRCIVGKPTGALVTMR